jgi:hypothetical protein
MFGVNYDKPDHKAVEEIRILIRANKKVYQKYGYLDDPNMLSSLSESEADDILGEIREYVVRDD